MGFLRVKGTKIVDSSTESVVVLTGSATGGHLNMENFITGYPGHETEHKEALLKVLGKEKFDFFFEKFYEYFWTDADAKFFKSCGFNCLRIPFNYRHFLDDTDLSTIKLKGFELLDRMVDICSENKIYVVLDLHAVPGGQNQDWHSDSGIHKALFWQFGTFQDAIIKLWEAIARRYGNNTWIAGYNPLNEPADSKHTRLVDFYVRVEAAIRKFDSNHMLFLDANTYAMDFSKFPEVPFSNTVYAIHDYTLYGFPISDQPLYTSSKQERLKLRKQYERKITYMHKHNVPVWNGEFGPVYASEVRGDKDPDKINESRYKVLKDQLEIYRHGDPCGDGSPISWSIWVYKDIGYQGLTFVSSQSKWYQVLGSFFERKQKLGLDYWGRDADPRFEEAINEFKSVINDSIPEKFREAVYPGPIWDSGRYIDRVVREMILSQYLSYEFAECFRNLTYEELDEMASSFKFENLEQRETLNQYLSEY